MENNAFINYIDYHIAKDKIDINEFVNTVKFDGISFFENKNQYKKYLKEFLPVKELFIEKSLSYEDMIMDLLEKNRKQNTIVFNEINYILLAYEGTEELKHLGQKIQNRFGVNKDLTIMQLSGNYCANIDVAIGVAQKLVQANAGIPTDVLIITGNKVNALEDRIIGTYAILSDGVGLMLISNRNTDKSIKIIGQNSVVEGVLDKIDFSKDNTIIHYLSYVSSFNGALDKNNISASKFSTVFLHNANIVLTKTALKSCGIDETCFYVKNQFSYGHLNTVDLIINLKDYMDSKYNAKGYLASMGMGVTGSYITTIFEVMNASV